jgi:hypothetical protein
MHVVIKKKVKTILPIKTVKYNLYTIFFLCCLNNIFKNVKIMSVLRQTDHPVFIIK